MSNRTSAKPGKAALKLHQQARDHNYDDSPGRLRRIIRSRACDLGTALLIYWRGDANWYRMYSSKFEMAGDSSADVATFDVMVEIEQRVLEGKYKSFSIPYTPFKDLGTNFARQHYSKRNPFEHFYCDLPLEMYGSATAAQVKSVRPKSTRPIGLSWVSEQVDDSLDPKTVAAIQALEKYSKDWGNPVKIKDEDPDPNNHRILVWFMGEKVPDDAFKHLKNLPGVTDLDCGTASTDALFKYLRYTPDLKSLRVEGNITSRGLNHLKHTPRLQRLTVSSKNLNDAAIKCLGHTRQLLELSIHKKTDVSKGATWDVLGQLKKLNHLSINGSLATSDLKWLSKLKLTGLILDNCELNESHVSILQKIAGKKTIRHATIEGHNFSEQCVKQLQKSFGKLLTISPGKPDPVAKKKSKPKKQAKPGKLNCKQLVKDFLKECLSNRNYPKGGYKSVNRIKDLPPEQYVQVVLHVLELRPSEDYKKGGENTAIYGLREDLIRRKLELTEDQVTRVAAQLKYWDLAALISRIEDYAKKNSLPKKTITQLKQALKFYSKGHERKHAKFADRIKALI